MQTRFKVGVFAIILDESERILLSLRNDFDFWNLPGGGLELAESPWDGVVREVAEETGLVVIVRELVGVYFKPQQEEIAFSFKCNITGGDLCQTEEARESRFFALNEIPPNTSPKQLERIKDYFIEKSKIVLKCQDGGSYIDTFRK